MSLRSFSDHCVPREIAEVLRRQGHEVLVLKDHLPIRSPDPDVIAKAQQFDSLLLSLNGDFADIVSYPPALHDKPFGHELRAEWLSRMRAKARESPNCGPELADGGAGAAVAMVSPEPPSTSRIRQV